MFIYSLAHLRASVAGTSWTIFSQELLEPTRVPPSDSGVVGESGR